jgi:hypothetical protein
VRRQRLYRRMPAALWIHHEDGEWKRCRAQGSATRIQQRGHDAARVSS